MTGAATLQYAELVPGSEQHDGPGVASQAVDHANRRHRLAVAAEAAYGEAAQSQGQTMTDTTDDPGPASTQVHRRSGGYQALPNQLLNDARLSFRARGLLAYMLARPPSWTFSAERIRAEGTEGREAVAAALRELARAGYYRADRYQRPDGRFGMVTHVAESPDLLPPVGTE